jgi:uncharacterized protein YjeT (DUF2065 family)
MSVFPTPKTKLKAFLKLVLCGPVCWMVFVLLGTTFFLCRKAFKKAVKEVEDASASDVVEN